MRTGEKLNETRYRVVALYKFVSIPDSELTLLKTEVEDLFRSCTVRGTILLATEGINGTISYPADRTEQEDPILNYLRRQAYFQGLRTNVSYVLAPEPIFHRLKIKVKSEIVTIGVGNNNRDGEETTNVTSETNFSDESDVDEAQNSQMEAGVRSPPQLVDPNVAVGTYVKAGKEWNALLQDPDVLVIDTRNDYEVAIGTFQNAVDPNTTNFREFHSWLEQLAKTRCPEESTCCSDTVTPKSSSSSSSSLGSVSAPQQTPRKKPRAVAMFCTGGIRCEKATSFALLNQVFPSDVPVYHLEGGILAYLRDTPPEESLWHGECFVFDARVAVKHGLEASTTYTPCRGCRRPVSPQQKESPEYEEGISCPGCYHDISEGQRRRFEQRHLQMKLAPDNSHIYDAKEKQRREEAAGAAVASEPSSDGENPAP